MFFCFLPFVKCVGHVFSLGPLHRNIDANIINIIDEGIGIEKEKLKNIFDKFYRVSTGDIHNVKGFGLGLFYVKNICTAHGWSIDVKSEPNMGTTFIIRIPT